MYCDTVWNFARREYLGKIYTVMEYTVLNFGACYLSFQSGGNGYSVLLGVPEEEQTRP